LQENEKKLEENLEQLREELLKKQKQLAQQEDITRKAEEMAKNVLVEQMEDEFTCIICHELFIEATTLACSHSYCNYCLKSWLKKKKSCPICRTDIEGTFVRSRVLDSAVEKIVQTMDEETKTRRREVSEERKKKAIGKTTGEEDWCLAQGSVFFTSEYLTDLFYRGALVKNNFEIVLTTELLSIFRSHNHPGQTSSCSG
jgi:hypothetical protein